jgi:hypothetical protein
MKMVNPPDSSDWALSDPYTTSQLVLDKIYFAVFLTATSLIRDQYPTGLAGCDCDDVYNREPSYLQVLSQQAVGRILRQIGTLHSTNQQAELHFSGFGHLAKGILVKPGPLLHTCCM